MARLILAPFLASTLVSVAASAMVPSDDRMMMIMGGIGNSLFFLSPMLLLIGLAPKTTQGTPSFGPRPRIVLAGLLATLVYVFVMAPGLG